MGPGDAGSAPVHLARHGQTAYNAELRFQGQLPVPLDARGREQARELAELVARREWAALYTSSLERAVETAAVVAARIGLEPIPDARFAETDAGDWTGRLFSEVHAEDPEGLARFLARDRDWAFPGGESFAQQGARVQAGLADVLAGPLPALVVCHGMTIRVALAHLHGPEAMAREVPNAALVPYT